MSREQGTFNASYSLEPNIEWTLDARQLVDTFTDLVLESTWDKGQGVFLPVGFFTSVAKDPDETKNGIYRLKNTNYLDPNNWEYIGNVDNITYLDLSKIFGLSNNSTPEEINDAFLNVGGIDNFRLDIIHNNKIYILRETGEFPDYKADILLTNITANDISIQMSYNYTFNNAGDIGNITNSVRLQNIGEGWTCNTSSVNLPNDLINKISLEYVKINALSNTSTLGEIDNAFNGNFNNFISDISNNNTIVLLESEYQSMVGKSSQTILSMDWSISDGSSPNILTLLFYSNNMEYLINIKIIQDPIETIKCERIDTALNDEEYRFRIDLLNTIESGATSEDIIEALGGTESYVAFRNAMINDRTPLVYLYQNTDDYESFMPVPYTYTPAERSIEFDYLYRGNFYRIKLRITTDTVAEFASKSNGNLLVRPASNITFDNSTTKMDSSSVQTAIEEVFNLFGKTFIGTQEEFSAMTEVEQQEYDTLIFVLP